MDFNIKPLGVSVEQFRNNPKLQIEAAANLANQFKSQFTEEDRKLAKEKGYNENALLAGAWLGGVKGVRKVLKGEGNPSDKHWSKEGKGTTVKDRMDKFNKMENGGVLKYEDGKKVTQSQAERAYNFINPADGFIAAPYYSTLPLYSRFNKYIPPRPEKDKATPVEEAYFKHYLNLDRDKELVPETKSKINWDKNNESNSEYVGIPQPVARRVQAIADTLNTGKIYREYDKYKAMNPDLPTKDRVGEIYKFGKTLLESNKGEQANELMSVKLIERPNHIQSTATGLEILGNFGLKWDKNNNTLKVYDTYDFPSWATGKRRIPERKQSLRIREDIKFEPKKGSYLLRDNMKKYHEDESKYYE